MLYENRRKAIECKFDQAILLKVVACIIAFHERSLRNKRLHIAAMD